MASWALLLPGPRPAIDAALRRALFSGTGVIELPAGVIDVPFELAVGPRAHDLEIRGASSGTTLRASSHFRGRALIRCDSASRIRFTGFTIDGNRTALEHPFGLPPSNQSFAQFTAGNGIVAVHVTALSISGVRFAGVPGFAILVNQSRETSQCQQVTLRS